MASPYLSANKRSQITGSWISCHPGHILVSAHNEANNSVLSDMVSCAGAHTEVRMTNAILIHRGKSPAVIDE